MTVIDQWTVLRTRYRSLREHIAQTEETRARRGIEHVACAPLILMRDLRVAFGDEETIHDIVRLENFIAVHPFWGPEYLCDTIVTTHWYCDHYLTALIQRDNVALLLELHPPGLVIKIIQQLLTRPDSSFASSEAVNMMVDWIIANHRNPKAFFAQEHVRRLIPATRDLTHVAVSSDFLDVDYFTGKKATLRGGNGSSRATFRSSPGDLELDYDALRALSMKGETAVRDWFKQEHRTGNQLKFREILPETAIEAIQPRLDAWEATSGIKIVHDGRFLDVILEQLYAVHAEPGPVEDELAVLIYQVAFLIHEYDLAPHPERAYALGQTVRRDMGLDHDAPDTDPTPRS